MKHSRELKETKSRTSFVDLSKARDAKQLKVLNDIHEKGICPFCPENLKSYHKNPLLVSGKYWLATKNQWPYKHTKYHFLFIHRTHIESIDELKPKEADELFLIARTLTKKFKVKSGGLCMRFGHIGKNGASVRHLHAHLISAKENLKEDEHVRFKVG